MAVPPGGTDVVIVLIRPRTLSVTVMFVKVTLPQLLTTPLIVFVAPTKVVDPQTLVTVMQGVRTLEHVALQLLVTFDESASVPRTKMVSVTGAQGLAGT